MSSGEMYGIVLHCYRTALESRAKLKSRIDSLINLTTVNPSKVNTSKFNLSTVNSNTIKTSKVS